MVIAASELMTPGRVWVQSFHSWQSVWHRPLNQTNSSDPILCLRVVSPAFVRKPSLHASSTRQPDPRCNITYCTETRSCCSPHSISDTRLSDTSFNASGMNGMPSCDRPGPQRYDCRSIPIIRCIDDVKVEGYDVCLCVLLILEGYRNVHFGNKVVGGLHVPG